VDVPDDTPLLPVRERARAAEPYFAPDRHRSAIAAICRGLDGIPLAIELASGRVAALGIEQVAARLEDPLHLLTGGRRTATPRHQTLRATLDWSYELLIPSGAFSLLKFKWKPVTPSPFVHKRSLFGQRGHPHMEDP